jgi:hypothetical protein
MRLSRRRELTGTGVAGHLARSQWNSVPSDWRGWLAVSDAGEADLGRDAVVSEEAWERSGGGASLWHDTLGAMTERVSVAGDCVGSVCYRIGATGEALIDEVSVVLSSMID